MRLAFPRVDFEVPPLLQLRRMSLDMMGWSPPDTAASLPAWGVGRFEQPAGSSPPDSEHGGSLLAR